MIPTYLKRTIWFTGLVLLQVLVLNNVHVAGYATPFLYIYFIIKLDSNTSRNALMLWAFSIGLCVDILSNTPGMNAATCTLLAFIRPVLLQFFSSRDNQESVEPSFKSIGTSSYFKYLVVCVLLHHSMLLSLESFSLFSFPVLLIKILINTILTILCILAIEGIRR